MFTPFSNNFSEALKEFDRYVERTGFEVGAATLISKDAGSRWYLYAGLPISIKTKDRELTIKTDDCFGLQETPFGYRLQSNIEGDGPYNVSYKSGYVLASMSTPISRRAQRSQQLKVKEV